MTDIYPQKAVFYVELIVQKYLGSIFKVEVTIFLWLKKENFIKKNICSQ